MSSKICCLSCGVHTTHGVESVGLGAGELVTRNNPGKKKPDHEHERQS